MIPRAQLQALKAVADQYGGVGTGRMVYLNNDLQVEPWCLFGCAAFADGARTREAAYQLADTAGTAFDPGAPTVAALRAAGLSPMGCDELLRGQGLVGRVPLKVVAKVLELVAG